MGKMERKGRANLDEGHYRLEGEVLDGNLGDLSFTPSSLCCVLYWLG